MKAVASAITRLTLFLGLALSLSACKNGSPGMNVGGDMSVRLDLPSANLSLEQMVKDWYKNILGRQPTQEELNNALAMLRGNLLSAADYQNQLAHSGEAVAKAWDLVVKALGNTSNTSQIVNDIINRLASGQITLDQIKAQLGIP